MNKKELAAMTAERLGIAKKDGEAAVNAVLELITEAVARGEKVQLVGFGTLEARSRLVHKGTTIGEAPSAELREVQTIQFRPGKQLREAITE